MRQRRTSGVWRGAAWVLTPVGVALLVGAVGYTLVNYRMVTVMGESMRPTFSQGDRLLVERIGPAGIRRGDVVLVDPPERYMTAPVLRRVIGTGGDHVAGEGNRVSVNGKPLDEPYVTDSYDDPAVEPYDVTVPEGRLFLLGDHRANSNDSRYHLDEQSGSFAAAGVRGRVIGNSAALTVPSVVGGVGIAAVLLGVGGFVAGRRTRRPVVAAAPWQAA
ncbi:signal peptidase I [Streptomyces sp. NPDC127100]|uniref:signal peptidase I n=1 Tax=Streptomyces sp. NPDC127100 TaxID=3347138 RepID=UPI0036627173